MGRERTKLFTANILGRMVPGLEPRLEPVPEVADSRSIAAGGRAVFGSVLLGETSLTCTTTRLISEPFGEPFLAMFPSWGATGSVSGSGRNEGRVWWVCIEGALSRVTCELYS